MEKPKTQRKKHYSWFIGIDVSKNKLDYAVMSGNKLMFHEEDKNTQEDILRFVSKLKELPGFRISKAIFCMESTGIYTNHLIEAYRKSKIAFVIENPIQIKRSMGLVRGKYDKEDAIRIAQYCRRNKDELRLWSARRPEVSQLSVLFTLRNRLLNHSTALSNPLIDEQFFTKKTHHQRNKKLCGRTIAAIKIDLQEVDAAIDNLLNEDPDLKGLRDILLSIPGIGRITAIQILISTNEFKGITSPKKFACYAGVAPFRIESGIVKRRARVSHFANKRLKSLLHICALNARKAEPELKAYFERKTTVEGKPKLVVINAIRAKLIHRVYACVRENRCYVKRTPEENKQQLG